MDLDERSGISTAVTQCVVVGRMAASLASDAGIDIATEEHSGAAMTNGPLFRCVVNDEPELR